ncbi:MAG: lipopolysaccharide kinase InaA family protein [Bacteroidota bacterium]|nr:lipopolysaccharide kinase InaA family protein [Bacteroidota bacterium]
MKTQVNPAFSTISSFLDCFPDRFDKDGTTIYKVRNEIKVFEVDGWLLNVKSYRIPIFFNRIVYTFFRQSKARRAFKNAAKLIELGFDTPTPVACIELLSKGLLERSFFVSLQCPYPHLLWELANSFDPVCHKPIVEAFGQYVGQMHEAGICHKDLSPGNVLFESDATGIHFSLVDLNRMKFCRMDLRKGCKNLERLRGNETFFRLLADSYARSRHFDSKECYRLIHDCQSRSVKKFARKSKHKKWRRRIKKWLSFSEK